MADREKVIKGLEHCSSGDGCKGCPYSKNESVHVCSFDCIRDAIALLKEHEPIQIKILEDYGFIKFGECPKCKSFINNRVFPKSCGCGQAVKWK